MHSDIHSDLDIRQITQQDMSALRAYWSIVDAAGRVDVPLIPVEPFEELANEPAVERSMRRLRWVAWGGGRPVGVTALTLPTLDNTGAAGLTVAVHPEERRRGIGRALLSTAVERMRLEGRTHAFGDTAEPLDGATTAGSAFAASAGAERALEEICRVLELDTVSDEQLNALEGEATRPDYELVQWVGSCSDDVVYDIAVLTARMRTDAPMGDLQVQPQVWDRDRVREAEAGNALLGRRWVTTAARHLASGRVVAYTDIGVSGHDESTAYQWMTIVAPQHRGRRLGLLLKAANLRLLRREMPGVQRVITWNAESNAHMIAINERLGFAPQQRFCQWQLKVPS